MAQVTRVPVGVLGLLVILLYYIGRGKNSDEVVLEKGPNGGQGAVVSESTTQPKKKAQALVEVMDLVFKEGNITWQLYPDAAPKTVESMRQMVKENYLVGCSLYRAELNFCLQGGCWNHPGKTYGHPATPLEYKLPNREGWVSMARTADPDSATSEFSMMMNDNSVHLGPHEWDKGFAVFARIGKGGSTELQNYKFQLPR